jgi:hypothetical protein
MGDGLVEKRAFVGAKAGPLPPASNMVNLPLQ